MQFADAGKNELLAVFGKMVDLSDDCTVLSFVFKLTLMMEISLQ